MYNVYYFVVMFMSSPMWFLIFLFQWRACCSLSLSTWRIFLDFFLGTLFHMRNILECINMISEKNLTPRDWWRNEILKSVIASIDIITHRLHFYKLGKLDTQSISYFMSDTLYTHIIFVSLTIMAKNILHLNKYIYSEILYDKKSHIISWCNLWYIYDFIKLRLIYQCALFCAKLKNQ